jgi:hypothetical protein
VYWCAAASNPALLQIVLSPPPLVHVAALEMYHAFPDEIGEGLFKQRTAGGNAVRRPYVGGDFDTGMWHRIATDSMHTNCRRA